MSSNGNNTKNDKSFFEKHVITIAISIAITAFFIYFLFFAILADSYIKPDNDAFGTFGDFIGGVLNPIFSLLIIYLLIKDLAYTRAELKQTNKQIERSNEIHGEKKDADNFNYDLEMFEKNIDQMLKSTININSVETGSLGLLLPYYQQPVQYFQGILNGVITGTNQNHFQNVIINYSTSISVLIENFDSFLNSNRKHLHKDLDKHLKDKYTPIIDRLRATNFITNAFKFF